MGVTVKARAGGLTAAADPTAVWILCPEADRPGVFTVLHHAFSDPRMLAEHVQTLRGEVRPHCVGAIDHSLWIIYPHGEVQTIRAEPSVLQNTWQYSSRVEPNMPAGISVRAVTLTRNGPWVLVRIDDAQTLADLDKPGVARQNIGRGTPSKRQRNIAIGLPPDYGLTQDGSSPANGPIPTTRPTVDENGLSEQADPDSTGQPEGQSVDANPAPTLPVDRLIHLRHGVWQVRALPADWPHGAEAWLVADNTYAGEPTLVALSSRSRTRVPVSVVVYRVDAVLESGWSQETYLLGSSAEVGGVSFIGVEGQLVAGRCRVNDGTVTARLSVLRGGKEYGAGELSLSGISPTGWSLMGTGTTATLLGQVPAPANAKGDAERLRFKITRADVRGGPVLEPTDLLLKTHSPMDDLAQYVMLGFIAVLVTVLMLAFWRRDASWNRLALPPKLMVADLGRRAFAAAVDMAPGLIGSMWYFGLSSQELMLRWPGNGIAHTLEQMMPGAVVIGVFVGHTTVSELIFSRTLGKALAGLRTTSLDGSRPRAWQVLVRGLLKALDLIPGAWLLLMLPVIAPHRQRLGDLVARTVVVCDAPTPAVDETNNERDDST